MAEKLIIIGDKAFAEIAYEYFKHDSDYEAVAFSINKDYITKKELFGLPIVPFEQLENLYSPKEHDAFVAITYNNFNRTRTKLYRQAKSKGYKLANYISSKAFVWKNVEIGENCFIFENNTVQPFVKIGNNVILWSGNHIGHHSIVKDNCFISSHVVISGYCEVNENCFIGVNATLADNINIAKDCFIGAGATILKNTEEEKIYPGIAAEPSKVDSLRFFKIKELKHEMA